MTKLVRKLGDLQTIPLLSVDRTVATITLNRPEHHNRLDPADLPVLRQHLAQVQLRDEVRLLVVTGAGQQSFCAGYTLGAILGELNQEFEETLLAFEQFPLPTLCALNGSAYGGGSDLALCCDFRLGLVGMQAFMPAARFALHYHPSGMRRYVQQLGLSAAKKMLLTAQTLQAPELLSSGFLTELLDDPLQLQQRITDYATALEACDLSVVKTMKQQLNAIAAGDQAAMADRSFYLNALNSDALKQRLAGVKRATISG